jgi:hypothetical protein
MCRKIDLVYRDCLSCYEGTHETAKIKADCPYLVFCKEHCVDIGSETCAGLLKGESPLALSDEIKKYLKIRKRYISRIRKNGLEVKKKMRSRKRPDEVSGL